MLSKLKSFQIKNQLVVPTTSDASKELFSILQSPGCFPEIYSQSHENGDALNLNAFRAPVKQKKETHY